MALEPTILYIIFSNRCNFEIGFCDWKQSDNNEFNWRRINAGSTPASIYPQRDHTTNTAQGSYIFIETTGKKNRTSSILYGPIINSAVNSECQIRFYYFMNGKSVGRLNINYREANGGSFTQLWSQIGEIGDRWERSEVILGSFNTPRQLIIEAVTSENTNESGIVALDDISFNTACTEYLGTLPTIVTTTTAKPCGVNGYQCQDGTCISNTKICDFNSDCSNNEDEIDCGTCDFENGMCGWYLYFLKTENKYGIHSLF